MTRINKSTDKAFILSPQKANEFLKQDNCKFKEFMKKIEDRRKHHNKVGVTNEEQ